MSRATRPPLHEDGESYGVIVISQDGDDVTCNETLWDTEEEALDEAKQLVEESYDAEKAYVFKVQFLHLVREHGEDDPVKEVPVEDPDEE